MNALTPALPAVQTPPAGTAPPAPGDEPDGGFADALQQARQPKAAARDKPAERPRETGKGSEGRPGTKAEASRPADKHKADKAADAAEATAPDGVATRGADPAATAAASADTLLPPWLEAALARPARTDPAMATTRRLPDATPDAASAAGRGKDITAAAHPAAALAPELASAAQATPAPGRAEPEVPAESSSFAAALQLATGETLRTPLAAETVLAQPAVTAGPAVATGPLADSPAPAEVVEREISAPLHGPEFAPALGAQLNLLVKDGVTEARLHLHPAEMGPISVQIQIEGQTARVEMVAEQAATRQVLEQSMPVLAGALRDNGLTLAGGGVFEQARDPRQGSGNGQLPPGHPDAASGDPGDLEAGAELRPAAVPQGMLDLYA